MTVLYHRTLHSNSQACLFIKSLMLKIFSFAFACSGGDGTRRQKFVGNPLIAGILAGGYKAGLGLARPDEDQLL